VALPDEHQHIALPKLYGAPAYARPPKTVETLDRPVDPDDLPLEVERTEEERLLAEAISDGATAASSGSPTVGADLQPRPFSLRSLGRIIGGSH
jgi:hypothetical protein